MRTRLSEATTRHFVILGTPVILIAGGLIAFESGGYRLAALVLGISILALGILAWQFRPKWWGNTRVQAISITILGGIAMVVVTDELWLAAFAAVYERLQSAFPEALPVISFQPSLTFQNRLWTMVALGAIFVALNYIWGRQNTLPAPDVSRSEEEPFGKKEYEQLRDEYCDYMLRQLDQYDDDLNWSDTDYTKLEAEVEVDRRGNRNPRVEKDLVRAIRRDRTTRAFLLLGDPGSGKSVSLRRLCRQLYGEVAQTGVVPVYINLREWDSPADPTDEQLSDFIVDHMKQAAGRAGKRFLNQWYEPMLSAGRFFFLLDSFDELPSVLDCDDASPRIKEISRTFDRFFHDIHQCRGVLASRRFRQPRGFQGRRMSIRPLKETQIREAMTRWLSGLPLNPTEIIRDLFRNRPELVPVVRNPFLADLTSQYLIQHNGELPPNQFAIYDSFIRHRLKEEGPSLTELGLEEAQVLDAATHIARKMYDDPEAGLEVETNRIVDWIPKHDPEAIIDALFLIRLIRLSKDTSKRFSFVHRRFAEFFVVRSLVEDDQPTHFKAILEDSRWRDCLVVFCGVAPEDKVQPIANFCMQVIEEQGGLLSTGNRAEARSVVHSLRFLRDAFIARPKLVDEFRPDLAKRLLGWIRESDLLAAKIATECLGLLGPAAQSNGLKEAFGRSSAWLRETAFIACRQLPSLDEKALQSVRVYIRTIPAFGLLRGYRDLAFSLSLSESLRGQLWAFRIDVLWLVVLWSFCLFLGTWLTIIGLGGLLSFGSFAVGAEAVFRRETKVPSVFFRPGGDTSIRIALSALIILTLVVLWVAASPLEFRHITLIFLTLSASVILPWEVYLVLVKFFLGKRDSSRGLINPLVFGLGVVTILLYFYWSRLLPPSFVQEALDAILRWHHSKAESSQFERNLFVCLVSIGLFSAAVWLGALFFDHLRLRRWSGKDSISLFNTHSVCKKLILKESRHKFLETLRLRQVELKGDPIPLPDEDWVDDGVREGMARLESMWFGLDE